MELHKVRRLSIFAALALVANAFAGSPKGAERKADFVNVTCKIFVTEAGVAKTVEVLAIEPALAPSAQASIKKAVSEAVLTWGFKPNQENGKPVAGYVVVPVHMDLAEAVPRSGT